MELITKETQELKEGVYVYKDTDGYIFIIDKITSNKNYREVHGATIHPKEDARDWNISEDSIISEWVEDTTYYLGTKDEYPEYFI